MFNCCVRRASTVHVHVPGPRKLEAEELGNAVLEWAEANPEIFKTCFKRPLVYRALGRLPADSAEEKLAVYGPHKGDPVNIVTMNNGFETKNVMDEGFYLVYGPKGERYTMNAAAFRQRYVENVENVENAADKTYSPRTNDARKGTVVSKARLLALGASDGAAQALTNDDPSVCKIKATWGIEAFVAGSVLIQEAPGKYYGIDKSTFLKTYEPCDW